jgi:transposase
MMVVVSKAGDRVLGPVRVSVEARERLSTLLTPFRPLEAVVETSSSWPWLHERLTGEGVTFVLAHAKRLRAIAEANYKRDEIDAELLARMRLAGLIPEVYPTPGSQREWAILVRHRAALVAQRTMLANRIHAQLHTRGLSLDRGELLTKTGREWVRTVAWPQLGEEQQRLIRSHLRLIRHLGKLIKALDRRIRQVAQEIAEARLLQSVPGIGPYRSLLLCAELLPVSRFPSPAHLASYAGLVPRSSLSGQRAVRHGPIPKGANRQLRGALVRAAVSHVRHAPESWLTLYYTTQRERLGRNVARVAAARKLARAVHAMLRTGNSWKNEVPHRGELHEPHAALTA